MQVTPGQTPLSLAMLKALGTQSAAPQEATQATQGVAAKPAGGLATAAKAPAAEPSDSLATARNLPRGSFVDLRV